jgi:hypothetical protein
LIVEDVIDMSPGRKQSVFNSGRSILKVTVACIACWSLVPSVSAQKSESPVVMASLTTSTIQPEFILTTVRQEPDRPAAPRSVERPVWQLPVRRHKPTDAEAWEKFDSEYRPAQRSPSPVKRQLETAKFGLDTTAFAVDRFVRSIRDHADFNYDHGHLRRTPTTPLGKSRDNPRVKLDLELTDDKPYAGVRIVIPIGN